MNKSDAMFWGAIVGVIPALWVGAYLFHIASIHLAREQWWGFPWYVTVIGVVALIDWVFAWYFGWMVEGGSDETET